MYLYPSSTFQSRCQLLGAQTDHETRQKLRLPVDTPQNAFMSLFLHNAFNIIPVISTHLSLPMGPQYSAEYLAAVADGWHIHSRPGLALRLVVGTSVVAREEVVL